MRKKNLLRLSVIVAALFIATLIDVTAPSVVLSIHKNAPDKTRIATLANGKYQFCSQPDPKDWQDGAGVCFNFSKAGDRVSGYYGYPHSDRFVCIRGKVNDSFIKGEALEILWAVNPESNISKSKIEWDSEHRLTLGKGNIIRTEEGIDGTLSWVFFPKASLNVSRFYRYSAPRMTPPSQLCLWN
ncbi:hypothetical protein WA1_10900 [Scytonema hofmannii PCC 7110]|uniref:Uncharacterized protein n=1 Tax=Scytonema hofmannii PCC 7110 TaxID=128403 RepID=A0A139XFV9_9CYAN|nr:hypothetical protein WA1_10900 [Scytonema hofmannii PCC 7110]